MKKTYHLCLSAGEEILFRDTCDYNRGFNCFALSLSKTDSVGLVEAFMSTHCHLLVQTEDPDALMYSFRNSYSKYFNNKYHRCGKLGEDRHFSLDVVGYHHRIAAASYVLRNPLHHGVAPIPYSYPHSSVNAIFRQQMGKFHTDRILKRRYHSRYIGKYTGYPDSYKMTDSGLFLRESVLDIPQVENMFITPRAFNYYMSRRSSEEWELEQQKDNDGRSSIGLWTIEGETKIQSLDQMLGFENGKSDYRRISDIDLCTQIDRSVYERYGRRSIYELDERQRNDFANYLVSLHHCSESQLRRCLAFNAVTPRKR